MMQQTTALVVQKPTTTINTNEINQKQQSLFSTSNIKKFTRRHSEKIKENNYNKNTNKTSKYNPNRKTLLPLLISNQTTTINSDKIQLLNDYYQNNTSTATQSLLNLAKFESANLDQIKSILSQYRNIETLKTPSKILLNDNNNNNNTKTESLDVDNNKNSVESNLSNLTSSTLTPVTIRETLFKFKKNSKCKKQTKKAKLNSNGDSSLTSSNSSSLAPMKIITPTAPIRSSSSSFDSSSTSSPSSLSSPSTISSQSQPFFNSNNTNTSSTNASSRQNNQQAHHNNRHRHRNYKCHNFDQDESINDPDSIAVPIDLINTNNQVDNHDEEEEEEEEEEKETSSCITIKTNSNRLYNNEYSQIYIQLEDNLENNQSNTDNNDSNRCLINNNKDKIVEEEEIDDIDSINTIKNIDYSVKKSHFNFIDSNLMEIQNENEASPLLVKSPENSLKLINNNTKTTSQLQSLQQQTSYTNYTSNLNSLLINNAFNSCFANLVSVNNKKFTQRYKLLVEGDLQVCKLQHSRNVLSKLLNSKLLRRWKAHRIILTDTEIYSTTKTDYMDSSIPYHTITEISSISKWEPGQKYCLRIATTECHYLLQTNNIYIRDQWIHSILWKKHKFKSERVLRNAVRPEILIREIKNMIDMSTTTPIDDSEISQHPLELVSEILQKHKLPKQTHEEVIVALSPLLEKNHPSPEICDFFSRHCRDSPRSHIVIEMFSPVVQRILKHNGDFGRYPRMRLFVQDYLMALVSQNAGLQTVQNFVISMHSTSSQCPFPRVLPNFVSVCLASIHACFETHRHKSSQPVIQLSPQEQEDQLICHTTMMYTMSKFEDWRINLAQLLQSVPFPDQVLTHEKFIKIFKNVVKNFAQDLRCEVHQTLLGIREGKEGWFEIFCPGGISCDDDGELFGIMLQTLIGCCCKKKRFLLSINKMLSHIMVLAIREVPCAIETLCAMLDLDGVENVDNKLKIISTLQSTELGLKHYAKVCERQMQLKELQSKGGPRKLALPSRSTDEDLAKLLLSGSFGNLECLSLAFTNVTSACAEYLIKLPSLRYLNLWSTKFGDQGLELISEHLQRLQVLNLCETPVTDKGLACLASMKQLRKLNLNSTNLSALTFEGLKECLPALQECDIRYTDAW